MTLADEPLSLAGELAPLVARRWLLVGIGSDLRGDDAFGPLLARPLHREELRPVLRVPLVVPRLDLIVAGRRGGSRVEVEVERQLEPAGGDLDMV